MNATASPPPEQVELWPRIFAVLFGGFLGLALLKFGNPPIMERWVTLPANLYELLLGFPWPIGWAYTLLVLVVMAGLPIIRRESNAPSWMLALPLVWLAWQCLAATQAVDGYLAKVTVKHFAAGVVCFYLGFFCLSAVRRPRPFWLSLFSAFIIVLAVGWEQHFGGLAESRAYFLQYIYPHTKDVPAEYMKKISSTRIFSTLFYPNTLAGALLLLLPPMLAGLWQLRAMFTVAARSFLMAVAGLAALGCLIWSGSKGGALLMLLQGLIVLWRLPYAKRLKLAVVGAVLLVGLTGFFWKYAAFFQKGATSVSARFDYWRAALITAQTHPLFGTGPGTFAIPYEALKRPESEMSRLVHNDYLEQASDSGIVGLLLYSAFIITTLAWSFPKHRLALSAGQPAPAWFPFAVWLGVLGWSLQGLVEFALYIPALAWTALAFLGWLMARRRSPIQRP